MLKKLAAYISIIILVELIIFFWSAYISDTDTMSFQLAARYSARVSFFLILTILFRTGRSGLNTIYQEEGRRGNYLQLIVLFSINHLIHFFYLSMNLWFNNLSIINGRNVIGALAYVAIVFAPFCLWRRRVMSRRLYSVIYSFLFGITAIFFVTYLGRLSKDVPQPSSKLFFIFCLITIVSLAILNVYRIWTERRLKVSY